MTTKKKPVNVALKNTKTVKKKFKEDVFAKVKENLCERVNKMTNQEILAVCLHGDLTFDDVLSLAVNTCHLNELEDCYTNKFTSAKEDILKAVASILQNHDLVNIEDYLEVFDKLDLDDVSKYLTKK